MADEVISVEYVATERGLQQIEKLIGQIRKQLDASGADVSKVEGKFDSLEKRVLSTQKALSGFSKTASGAGAEGAKGAATTEAAWKRVQDQIDKAQKVADRGINAATQSQTRQGVASSTPLDGGVSAAQWDKQFKAATASAKEFEAAQRKVVQASVVAQRQSTASAAAATASARNLEAAQDSIISQRYALYDVSRTYGAIGTALAGVAIYAGVVGAKFESAFTAVERTLQGGTLPAEVEGIRASLVRLNGQIPVTFQELSQIATIGNQMGIAKEEVVDFTGTIARFASVSGMSIESVTKAFGGFMAQTGLAPQYLENLGSAVAKVGIDSNATEEQIVSLMREIAAGAQGAGFTADAIVGLSGTLAGLQIAPERARGSLDTYFGTLDRAVAKGGEDLANFALVVGTTSDELERMVRNGEGADVLRGFLEGLNGADDSAVLTQALDALNLSQLRVSNTFKRLSNDLSIFDRDQQNANNAFIQGAELQRQYAMTVDDLASQWVIFINNINGFVDAVSGGAIPTIAALFQAVNSVLVVFNQWLGQNQWAGQILAFGTAVAGALGVILLFRGASMAATASMLAMNYMTRQAGAGAIVASGGFRGLIGTLLGVRNASNQATGALFTLRSAMRAVLASTGIGLLVTLGGGLLDTLMGSGGAAKDASLSMAEYNKAVASAGRLSGGAATGADDLARSLGGGGGGSGGGGGGGGVSGAAQEAAQKVRTLVDWVNDLNGVFRRSSDIRFGSTAAMDEITLKWIKLSEETEKYRQEVRSLTADKSLQQYWLGVAELYDDQVRASQIRENIAEIDDKLADANEGASRELVGNSKAAIENRKAMRDLVGGYEGYISALAAAGASQEDIQAAISAMNGDFSEQAKALGFSGVQLKTYSARFGDLTKVVGAVPRNVTVAFNGDPALQALGEFFAKVEEDARAAGAGAGESLGGGIGDGLGGGFGEIDPSIYETPAEEIALGFGEKLRQGLANFFQGGILWLLFTEEGREWASLMWTAFEDWWSTITAVDWWGAISVSLDVALGNISTAAGMLAGTMWAGIKSWFAALTSLNWWNAIVVGATSLASTGSVMYEGAKAWGSNMWAGIKAALSGITSGQWLSAITVGAWRLGTDLWNWGNSLFGNFLSGFNAGASSSSTAAPGRAGRAGGSFASGGYTGPGHWLTPAGTVHKGEYVIPKRHVNQRTGLPSMDYVQSLQKSKGASGPGYAGGGYVSGGGFGGPIELGPASLHYLGQAMSVRLGVDGRDLANSSSRGDKSLAWAGTN